MTRLDHARTRTYAGKGVQTMRSDGGPTARQRLFLDIRDVRLNFGRKYNQGLLEMIDYSKTLPQFRIRSLSEPFKGPGFFNNSGGQ